MVVVIDCFSDLLVVAVLAAIHLLRVLYFVAVALVGSIGAACGVPIFVIALCICVVDACRAVASFFGVTMTSYQ